MTDVDRKGLIKHTSVEANGPYIDIVYGMKTDPENATRTRIGNLSGITTPYWRQLKDYGIFCDNGYFRGDFMLRPGKTFLRSFRLQMQTFVLRLILCAMMCLRKITI